MLRSSAAPLELLMRVNPCSGSSFVVPGERLRPQGGYGSSSAKIGETQSDATLQSYTTSEMSVRTMSHIPRTMTIIAASAGTWREIRSKRGCRRSSSWV